MFTISPSVDLSKVVLVDDQKEFALDDAQQRNILWLQDTYNYVEDHTVEEVAKLGLHLPPPSRKA